MKGLPREYSLENPNIDIRVIKRGKYFFVFNEGITEEKNAVLFNGKRYRTKMFFGLKNEYLSFSVRLKRRGILFYTASGKSPSLF